MAAAFRLFDRFGFNEGVAGHLTARDPERPDCFWVNPFGLSFGLIRASDLILVNHEGEVVEGDWPVNMAAFAIHSQVHAARPDVQAAAHTHSKAGRAWSTLGRLLDPITQDACSFFEDHGLFDDYTGVVIDVEEGKRIAHALGDNKAAILRNHGMLTVGHSVDEAAWLVHHDGAHLRGPAPRRGRRHAHLDRAGDGPPHPRPGRQPLRRLVQLPAALRQDRRRSARPARLSAVGSARRCR